MIELVLRIGFSLQIVLGLMWGLAKLARRPLTGNRGTGNLSVLTRQPLGRNSSVAIVQVADRALVLGVTDAQVSLLGETDLEAFERHPHHAPDVRATVPLAPDLLGPAGFRSNAAVPDDLTGHLPAGPVAGRLDGSLLSPRTWRSTLDFLRERTARR